jgi:hypothetical protein
MSAAGARVPNFVFSKIHLSFTRAGHRPADSFRRELRIALAIRERFASTSCDLRLRPVCDKSLSETMGEDFD